MTDDTMDRALLDGAFRTFEERMVQLLDYASEIAALLKNQPRFLPELADSIVVLAVTRLEAFFSTLVSLGTRYREHEIRKHFQKHGRQDAQSCDLPTLVKMVRGRVSFGDGFGARQNWTTSALQK